MKLFTTRQIAEIDQYTIKNEPVADIDLMERAALQISQWLVHHIPAENRLIFFAGPGNNGGDALAVARQMASYDYQCEVFLLDFGKELKNSPAINRRRLEAQGKVKLSKMNTPDDFPAVRPSDVLIDGLFGSGLSRPLEGLPAAIVHQINECSGKVVAVDIPSGLMGEDNSSNISENIVRADYTLTFQFPKISFLFAENEKFTGKWEVLPIGLLPEGMAEIPSPYLWVEKEDIKSMLPRRFIFSHKGTFGHALLIAGSYGKMGAAVLASKGCLRSGAGLLTTHVPRLGYPVIQSTVPEAMASVDQHDSIFTGFPDLTAFTAIGAGPGIGLKPNSKRAFHELILKAKTPMVLDADALNILAEEKQWLAGLPENSILTPHPGEFRQLAGETANSYSRIRKQQELARSWKVIIVLKGAYTTIATPGGELFFNSTGNPGMATAGCGDMLTGIILGLLAQRIDPRDAAVAGVYLHGRAGDLARKARSEYGLIAGDIADFLGEAFLEME